MPPFLAGDFFADFGDFLDVFGDDFLGGDFFGDAFFALVFGGVTSFVSEVFLPPMTVFLFFSKILSPSPEDDSVMKEGKKGRREGWWLKRI